MDKTKESLSIRLLDSHSNPLKNQEFRLFEVQNGRRSIINTIFTSNENGEAFFNAKEVFKEGTQSFEIGLHNTLCYKRKPIYNHRYLLRNYEYGYLCEVKFAKKADDASIEKVTLKPKEYLLDNNEKIILKFYAGGDIVELEAFYDVTKIQEDEIKWGYTLLTASSQEHSKNLDTLNKNQLTNDKKDSSLFDDKISTTCYHIEKRGDIAILSGTPIDMMQDNPQAYRGKTIQIALPKTTNQQAILIFAYKNTPNYRASQLIRLNDYPQITIDCTLAETLRAYTRQDNIATLGWGVSYVCQRLWHDNPSDAKELSKLIYIDSHSPDFIESIPNATMQSIVKEVLPRITLKEFSKDSNNKCPAIKSQIQEIKDNNLRFYVELDWDRFYMQFPLMRESNNQLLQTLSFNDINDWMRSNFLNSKFYNFFMEWINTKSNLDIITRTANTNNQAQLIVDFSKIYEGKTKNKDIFLLKNIEYQSQNSCNEQSLSNVKSPYKLWGNCFYAYGIGDIDFAMQTARDMTRVIALYALTGKFNIYYIPSLFKITQGKDNAIDIQITEIKAYIFDGFDFIGTPEQFVGAWNYDKMEFIAGGSSWIAFKEITNLDKIFSTSNVKQSNKTTIFNQDYQNTQTHFNLGLDFRILTSTFKDIEVFPLSMPIQIKVN
ncbi:hypothetical protein HPU229336_00170 [Helicobacter pullorum]|uniref:Uncharacterized protein n=1 Tax=Helicobacter pullorum TaxID=35818 RepID=A0AAW3J8P7_9HELI|nr:DUF6402 family protein [Helicobacter pullorum]KPH51564.1 hypothetical protein HPU229336_00170 [Helicobacter pullorum]